MNIHPSAKWTHEQFQPLESLDISPRVYPCFQGFQREQVLKILWKEPAVDGQKIMFFPYHNENIKTQATDFSRSSQRRESSRISSPSRGLPARNGAKGVQQSYGLHQ